MFLQPGRRIGKIKPILVLRRGPGLLPTIHWKVQPHVKGDGATTLPTRFILWLISTSHLPHLAPGKTIIQVRAVKKPKGQAAVSTWITIPWSGHTLDYAWEFPT